MAVNDPPKYRKPCSRCESMGTCVIDGVHHDLYTCRISGELEIVTRKEHDYNNSCKVSFIKTCPTAKDLQFAYIRAQNLGIVPREVEKEEEACLNP